MFVRQFINKDNDSKVITYISIRFIQLCFYLRKDIINNRDINFILFFNCILFLISIQIIIN